MQGILFIGIQASGKSTFYLKNFIRTHLCLSLDMLKTRHREDILFDACLKAKQPIVVDNTNPTKEERKKYIDQFKGQRFSVIGYYFSSSIDGCLERNSLRQGREKIPEIGIKATYRKLELPEYSEGFDQLYYVTAKNDDFKIEEWKDEV